MLSNSTITLIIIIGLLVLIMFYNTYYTNEEFIMNSQTNLNGPNTIRQQILASNIKKEQVIEDVASYFGDDMISNYSLNSKIQILLRDDYVQIS